MVDEKMSHAFLFAAVALLVCLLHPTETFAALPYCSSACTPSSSCDKACQPEPGETTTCGAWGACDSSAVTIQKAYPYTFPDPYGFGLRMEYDMSIANGHEAVSVTTQYSPDDGVTWFTDEQNRPTKYLWDNIHGDIECGSAKHNLESGRRYTLRIILNYLIDGDMRRKDSNWVTAKVEAYDPPVLYGGGHIPGNVRIDWQSAGLLPESRPGLLPETPVRAHNTFDVTAMPGASVDERIAQAIERAREAWRNRGETSIIYFPPGYHRIKKPIVLTAGDSNIVFQGEGAEGPNATILECQVGKDGTCFDIYGSSWGATEFDLSALLADDIEKGERVLTASLPRCAPGVNDLSCFAAGDWIHFWEANFPAESGAVVGQITQLESVNPDIVMKDAASKKYWIKYGLKLQKFRPVTNIGIENLKIHRLDSSKSTENQYGSGNNVKFQFAVNCWMRGVESELTTRHHVTLSRCAHIEVSGCYLHNARFYGGNSYGYGVVLGASTTNALIENNIFKKLRHAMGIGTGANGNVFTFNYSTEQYSTYSWWIFKNIRYQDSDICLHGRYPYSNLFEHNIVEFIEADDVHGSNGPYNTFIRNIAYVRNIYLYDAPHSSVLGSETDDYPAVSARGHTSLAVQGYGKTYLVGGKFVPYQNAPWISYLNGDFVYHPDRENYAMLKDISYYYASRPYFLSSKYTWPSLGPGLINPFLADEEEGFYRDISGTIPAVDRYRAGQETYISKRTR